MLDTQVVWSVMRARAGSRLLIGGATFSCLLLNTVACSAWLDYDDRQSEEGAVLCGDTDDNDFDGLVDCGESSCRPFCAPPVTRPTPLQAMCPPGWTTESVSVGDGLEDVAACGVSDAVLLGPCEDAFFENAIHVAPGGTGDGSETNPLGSANAAIRAARDGSVVVLAPGTYDELVTVDRPITLVGRCGALVRAERLTIESVDVELRQLVIAGRVELAPAARARLVRVEISSRDTALHLARGARLEITRSTIDAQRLTVVLDSGATARALDTHLESDSVVLAAVDSRVELDRVVLDGGVEVMGPLATVTARDVVLAARDVAGLTVVDEATVLVERASLLIARGSAVSVAGRGTRTSLTDLVVSGRPIDALVVADGGQLAVERAVVLGAQGTAIRASGPSALELLDVRAAGVDTVSDGRDEVMDGTCLEVSAGAAAAVTRARMSGSARRAIRVEGGAVTLHAVTLTATALAGCGPLGCDASGYGLDARAGSLVEVDGFLVERTNGCGVRVRDDAALTLTGGALVANVRGLCLPLDARVSDVLDLAGSVVFRDNNSDYMLGNSPNCLFGISVNCATPFAP